MQWKNIYENEKMWQTEIKPNLSIGTLAGGFYYEAVTGNV